MTNMYPKQGSSFREMPDLTQDERNAYFELRHMGWPAREANEVAIAGYRYLELREMSGDEVARLYREVHQHLIDHPGKPFTDAPTQEEIDHAIESIQRTRREA